MAKLIKRLQSGGTTYNQRKYDLGLPSYSTEDSPIIYDEYKEEYEADDEKNRKIINDYFNKLVQLNQRRINIDRQHKIPLKGKSMTLTNAGSSTGLKLYENLLDSVYKYGSMAGVSPVEIFGLPNQESTYGALRKSERNNDDVDEIILPSDLVSNWRYVSIYDLNSPFGAITKKVIEATSDRQKSLLEERKRALSNSMSSNSNDEHEKYSKEFNYINKLYGAVQNKNQADVIKQYSKEFDKLYAKESSVTTPPLLDAYLYYKSGLYNTEQPDHKDRVIKKGQEIMNSPQFKQWAKSRGYEFYE